MGTAIGTLQKVRNNQGKLLQLRLWDKVAAGKFFPRSNACRIYTVKQELQLSQNESRACRCAFWGLFFWNWKSATCN